MTFLNPLVLFGLLAAAIPIIIHLFNFRKPKKVDFSSVEFLKELQQNTMRRMRLKQWLLLLLRTLAIAALILSFSRPTLTGSFADTVGKQAASSIALIVDNSKSMDLRDAQGEYIEQAKALSKTVLDQMELGDEVSIFTSAGNDEEVLPYTNQLLARDAVDQIVSSGGGTTISQLLAAAQKTLDRSTRPNRQIYLVSDLQSSTFADSLIGLAQGDANIVLIPIGSDPPNNLAVESVEIKSKIIETDQAVRVEVGLRNYGDAALDDLVVSAYLDEQRVAQANASLGPQAFEVVELVLTPKSRGWLSGVIEIGSDVFESDNIRHFVMNVPERRRVLLVEGEGQTGRYVRLALSDELTRGRTAFDIESIPENRLPATQLGNYDAVILVGPKSLSSGEVTNVASYVQNGGGLMVFPGSEADKSGMNNLLARLGGGTYTTMMKGQGRNAVASLGRSDFEHPIFDGMFDTSVRSGIQMENIEFYQLVQYQAGGGNEQTIVRLNSTLPFLQELKSEAGLALFLTSMPDLDWSDLPVRGLFVPLMYRSLFYVSSGQEIVSNELILGQEASLKLRNTDQGQIVIKSPNGEEIIPEQRSLQGASLVQIPRQYRDSGIYEFISDGKQLSRHAFNEKKEESNLSRLSPEEARAHLEKMTTGDVQVLSNVNSSAELQTRLSEARIGVEIWNVLLVIALILLLLEMLVSVRWKGQSQT